ncbi:pantetheine-phosphate adenylyltransferase [Carnimonas nigrificans]|uniref:pantetheine-phosphate adenylyltransferase n=1 Tax=Carnimonas nigrificans TaxID=64323 RepID=UPI0004BCACF8|nr:pantetheine-phosphate adenylyltransferase [Carnimonas nigrificans]
MRHRCYFHNDIVAMPTIVYPGTFDPITLGHLDLITRAAPLFDRLVVAVADSSAKKPLFDLEQRIALVKEVIGEADNIDVIGFDTLTTELLDSLGANVMLRGLRSGTDFDYEWQLARMNQLQRPGTDNLFMMPSPSVSAISSSFVREISRMGGDISRLVPAAVQRALAERQQKER